jgi:hypothetical protein
MMTCEEFLEQAAAYALGILDPGEQEACTRHLMERGPHRGCSVTVEEARAVAVSLSGGLPGQHPSPRLWRAIEARLGDIPREPGARRRVWRELAGWFVAAAVIGVYFYSAPMDTRRKPLAAAEGAPTLVRDAMGLMTTSGTRLLVFVPRRPGAGRASVILNPAERRAMVLCDRTPPESARLLRVWATRGTGAPEPVAPLSLSDEGVASVQLGASLFEPSLPDRLLISADGPTAMAPTEVLLSAELR